jgi:hypothetical protein
LPLAVPHRRGGKAVSEEDWDMQVERIADCQPLSCAAEQKGVERQALMGANDNQAAAKGASLDRSLGRYASSLPNDAVAIIEPFPLATNQGGRARRGEWRLRFRPREKPVVDPLMGWTGSRDPLTQVELRFADREAAVRYCERLRLTYETRDPPRSSSHAPATKQAFELQPIPPLCCWPTGPHALCCGNYPALKQMEDVHA